MQRVHTREVITQAILGLISAKRGMVQPVVWRRATKTFICSPVSPSKWTKEVNGGWIDFSYATAY
jgi:hypothetical protein